jgi:hypothetical protein
MGSHFYWYFVPYQSDIGVALSLLQQQVLETGQYNPVNPFPFSPELNQKCKSPDAQLMKHTSILEALNSSEYDGTRSILDMYNGVSETPTAGSASPYLEKYLWKFLGSDRPSRQTVEMAVFWDKYAEPDDEEIDEPDPNYGYVYDWGDAIHRGECRYIVIYENDRPTEIFFGGFSFD